MRRFLVIAIFAVALPLAGRADTLGTFINNGSLSYTPNGVSPGSASFTANASSGTISAVLPSWGQGNLGSGGSFSLVENDVTLFQGTFSSATEVRNDLDGKVEFQVTATIKGRYYLGNSSEFGIGYLVFETTPTNQPCSPSHPICGASISGGFLEIAATPEPGTLALFGTGLLGIFGAVKKKIRP